MRAEYMHCQLVLVEVACDGTLSRTSVRHTRYPVSADAEAAWAKLHRDVDELNGMERALWQIAAVVLDEPHAHPQAIVQPGPHGPALVAPAHMP